MIPYGRQSVSEEDIAAVVDVLRSDFLTQGSMVPRFEQTVAAYCGAGYGVAVNSGTSALHIACLALGLSKDDWLWTSPITFVASANCALYCGAKADFVDIDPRTYNLSPQALEEKLQQAERDGCLPKIVVPVHYAGQPCDMEAIHGLGQHYGFKIIEDASHAVGAKFQGEAVGSGFYSDITVFSFHPVKTITTGEGGMALTNDPSLFKSMQHFRSHGITSTPSEMESRPVSEIWNYQQVGLGFNYRMTDIAAALGLSQMGRLDEFVAKRHSLAKRYDQLLADLALRIPWQDLAAYSSYHLYPIRFNLKEIRNTQREIYADLRESGILVNLHYMPVYLQPYFQAMGFERGYCPEAEKYFSETLSMPIYPDLTEIQQDQVIETLQKML